MSLRVEGEEDHLAEALHGINVALEQTRTALDAPGLCAADREELVYAIDELEDLQRIVEGALRRYDPTRTMERLVAWSRRSQA